jgi:membrane-bound metal-dependent hydrolase YbcI (DUF457 family)
MYPLGHFALGYFSGMIIGKFTREEVNIPIIWLISILPDVDIFFPFIEHRGPTHSIIIAILLSLPLLLKYRRGYPCFAALASHSLIGDYFTAYGCQLLWPVTLTWYKGKPHFLINGNSELFVEAFLFALMIMVIFLKRRWSRLHSAKYPQGGERRPPNLLGEEITPRGG